MIGCDVLTDSDAGWCVTLQTRMASRSMCNSFKHFGKVAQSRYSVLFAILWSLCTREASGCWEEHVSQQALWQTLTRIHYTGRRIKSEWGCLRIRLIQNSINAGFDKLSSIWFHETSLLLDVFPVLKLPKDFQAINPYCLFSILNNSFNQQFVRPTLGFDLF